MSDGGPVQVQRPQRFRDAMPKPLLIVFAVFTAAALAAMVLGLLLIPKGTVALEARRPPPTSVYTHDVGRLTPAPLPSKIPTAAPACDLYDGTRLVAGGDGVVRLRQVLSMLCPLAKGGLGDDVTAAARALSRATVEFGLFSATGVESTADLGARIVWLNAKYALRKTPVEDLAPVVLHEAFHLVDARATVDAEHELRARAVELAACKSLVPRDKWPRACKDAEGLLSLSRERALSLLESAGYRRPGASATP